MPYLVRGLAIAATIATVTLRHHHFHGSAIGYGGVALAAAISWAGLPGPGEATLIAAGVLAAQQRLDIGAVLVVAWIGATLGGAVGWAGGVKAGRPIFAAPGPLRAVRLRLLEMGDRLFSRYGTLAVFMTPSWVAGTNRMPWTRYLPANTLSALVWSLSIGLVAFLAGPPVARLLADLGGWVAAIVGVLALAALGFERRRRARGGADVVKHHHRRGRDLGSDGGQPGVRGVVSRPAPLPAGRVVGSEVVPRALSSPRFDTTKGTTKFSAHLIHVAVVAAPPRMTSS